MGGSHDFIGICSHEKKIFNPSLRLGDAVIFDLRTMHAGSANRGPTDRNLLYISYVMDSWVDAVNFHPKNTAGFVEMSSTSRKLLTRIDAESYIRTLEERLSA